MIDVRRACTSSDKAALATLLSALEDEPDAAALERIESASAVLCQSVGGDRRPFALLARMDGDAPVGCVTLSPFFPAPGGHWGLYLEELFVAPVGRRRGVATALLRAAADTALHEGYSRVFWTTTPDNAPALALYGKLLGHPSGKIHFQAGIPNLRKLARRPDPGSAN
jgi:ribosomal protein S18 acetylase RimI-like enzyme